MADEIRLGDKARDVITGYEGIVIATTQWLSNCDRLLLQAEGTDASGKPFESHSCDIYDAMLVVRDPLGLGRAHVDRAAEVAAAADAPDTTRSTGGPMPSPTRHR